MISENIIVIFYKRKNGGLDLEHFKRRYEG